MDAAGAAAAAGQRDVERLRGELALELGFGERGAARDERRLDRLLGHVDLGAAELLAQAFEIARTARIAGAFVSNALAVPLRAVLGADVLEAASPCCGGATSRWSRRSCATCRSASTCTSSRAS